MRRFLLLATCAFLMMGCDEGTGGRVTIRDSLASNLPTRLVVNARDSGGPWMRVADRQGVFEFDAPSGRYTLVHSCGANPTGWFTVVEATVAEMPEHIVGCGPGGPTNPPAPPAAFPWTIGLNKRDAAEVRGGGSAGYFDETFALGQSNSGKFVELRPGRIDITALARYPSQVVLYRDLEIAGPGTLIVDFAKAVTLEARPVKIDWGTRAPTELQGFEIGLKTANHAGWVKFETDADQLRMIPTSALPAGELQSVGVRLMSEDGSSRGINYLPRADELPDFVLPPRLEATITLPPTSPILRPKVEFTPIPNVSFYYVSFGGRPDIPDMQVTPGWLAGATTYVPPDLAQVPLLAGWRPGRPQFVSFNAVRRIPGGSDSGGTPGGAMTAYTHGRSFSLERLRESSL